MVVRTKQVSLRLRNSLTDSIEAYRIEHELSATEAFTAILELGLGTLEPCSEDSSDYQLQTDKLKCEVTELRRLVEMLTDRMDEPAPANHEDEVKVQMPSKRKKGASQPILDVVNHEVIDNTEPEPIEPVPIPTEPPTDLTDEEFAAVSGIDVHLIRYQKKVNRSNLTIGQYYFNSSSGFWKLN
jgi:hypothetical protein